MGEFIVDLIASNPWKMVLVEQGPWDDIQTNLYRVQDRLYNCVDAAIEGQLAEQFPESKGQPIRVRLDCYDLPESEVQSFFNNFSSTVPTLPDYKEALELCTFVAGISFEITFQYISAEC